MPIRPLLQAEAEAFGPEGLTALTSAFEQCLKSLRLVNRADPAVLLVAKRIIALAKEGERDPAILRDRVVSSFGGRALAGSLKCGTGLGPTALPQTRGL